MTGKDELADMIMDRLYDPGKFVERGPHPDGKRKDRQEPLDMWKLRAVMTVFEDIQKRTNAEGKVTVIARTAFRDPNPKLDGE